MEVFLLILFVLFLFIVLGIGGWILELFGHVFEFLLEGVFKSIGCLFWVIIIILILINL